MSLFLCDVAISLCSCLQWEPKFGGEIGWRWRWR